MKLLITLIALTFSSISFAKYTINVMAPLTIGNLENPNETHHEWTQFENNLQRVKEIGVDAISTDIWWGLVEKSEDQYNWAYYNKLISIIEKHNLKWVPILSFHQLGGNVGDEGYIPPPAWIWKKYIGRDGVTDENSLKYKSEQGNYAGITILRLDPVLSSQTSIEGLIHLINLGVK